MSRRTLLLIRHAKSGYPDGVEDHDRPLSDRGERDASALGAYLSDEGGPDVVLCSTALRARRTWELAEAGMEQHATVRYEPSLYLASPRAMLGLIRACAGEVQRLAIVAHNPGTQELAAELAGRGEKAGLRRLRKDYPTAGVAVLSHRGAWDDLAPGTAELTGFAVPRG